MLFLKNLSALFDQEEVPQKWLTRVRWLSHLLILSLTLNIGLLATFIYSAVKESKDNYTSNYEQATAYAENPPSYTNSEVVAFFEKMSFKQLVNQLANRQLIEDGYTYRDLALAYLVNYYHFNLERALAGWPAEERHLLVGKDDNEVLRVFPSLTDQDYKAILHFARTERWPLTGKGLFLQLQEQGLGKDDSLVEAFYHTYEFQAVDKVFQRAPAEVQPLIVVQILLDGDWQMIKDFVAEQYQKQHVGGHRWRNFLLDYIVRGSKTASYLVLEFDGNRAAHRLDDPIIITMLNNMDIATPAAQKFAVELLTSPRPNAVWELAAERLYQWSGEQIPESNVHMEALARFVPEEVLQEKVAQMPTKEEVAESTATLEEEPLASSEPSPPNRVTHVVQKGDTLWEIARQFDVDIKDIKENNDLNGDVIIPGQQLKISFSGA
ncbi:MAG: LysM peptidoglycan-binding domain-containing protein [Chlamydiota bacterium]